jgi:hypothetical protein
MKPGDLVLVKSLKTGMFFTATFVEALSGGWYVRFKDNERFLKRGYYTVQPKACRLKPKKQLDLF